MKRNRDTEYLSVILFHYRLKWKHGYEHFKISPSPMKGKGSILFLTNGLKKKIAEKNYKNDLRRNNYWDMYSLSMWFSKYFIFWSLKM
jgi:hypothetical protein